MLSEDPSNENYYLFRYNNEFVQSNIQIYPLLMQLNNNTYKFDELDRETFKGLPPLIVDSLPNRYGEKIHMLSLAGMLGYDYKKPGENSYEDVARLLHILKCDIYDIYQLFKRMVFNVLARNNDDHIKNISFLMDKKGIWKLAPAYDLSFSYNPNGIWTRHHQMRINNKVDDIMYNDLLTSGLNMGIKQKKVIELIEEVKNAIEKYDEYAKEANIPDSEVKKIKDFFPKIQ